MIGRIEVFLRRLQRSLSRSVWLARLLRLPASEGPSDRPGLVIIQIDGLSQQQLEQALDHNEMPFLKRLIHREHNRVHSFYSGLPSTTTAVQAELFYGVKTAVPAFAFRDKDTGEVHRMFEPQAAAELEERITADGREGLLKDGSAYSDNFTGGASETHFCASSLGWGSALRAANPFVVAAFLISNLYSFIRVGVLFVLEIVIAVVDFFRGFTRGFDFISELKFIPTRVGISILLRELCVIGGKIDISRGLPIIHMNLLGYDEQSHRRGPRSLFAHWTLKGIDDAVSRLWHATNNSRWRHYELWIYSDHGQAAVRPYHQFRGYSLEQAVSETVRDIGARIQTAAPSERRGIQTQRARLLGGRGVQRWFSMLGTQSADGEGEPVNVTAPGPVGHIYLGDRIGPESYDLIARELARTHEVPVVLWSEAPGVLCAHTRDASYRLPQDMARLFGAEHPFIDSMGDDLVRLCEHPNAGDLVVLGWRKGVASLTFAEENGAHGGLSPTETNGFAILPADTVLPTRQHDYLRPLELRQAALEYLGRRTSRDSRPSPRTHARAEQKTLRVMSYNVHSCLGMDGRINVERIARMIARLQPDVVALQELDVGRERTHGVDQAHQIAEYLEMAFHFHPAIHLEEERYGDAILTHLPERLIKADLLPTVAHKPNLEPRGALWVAIDLDGTEVQIINTHLGLSPRERILQADALLSEEWLGHEACRAPFILCGDFNAMPASPVCRRFKRRLRDAQLAAGRHRPKPTFPSRFPAMRIDHVYVSRGIETDSVTVPRSEIAQVASDHLPLVVDLRIG